MDIYVKPQKKVSLYAEAETSTKNNSEVSASAQPQGSCKSDFLLQHGISNQEVLTIGDVAEIVTAAEIINSVKNLPLINLETIEKKNYLISITDIVKAIQKKYPSYTIYNLGETDTLVQYAPQKSKDNPYFKWAKVCFVALVLLFGSSTAIMSFHTDGQIPKIFERYYSIFYGEEKTNPAIINIPYSIGLGVGIIVFYNHFMGKKITDDPTPIEVEMEKYDNDVTTTVSDMIRQNKSKRPKDGS